MFCWFLFVCLLKKKKSGILVCSATFLVFAEYFQLKRTQLLQRCCHKLCVGICGRCSKEADTKCTSIVFDLRLGRNGSQFLVVGELI